MRLRRDMFGPRHFLYADSMFALGAILLQQAAEHSRRAAAADPTTAAVDRDTGAEGKGSPGKSWWRRLAWGGRGGGAGNPSKAAQALDARGLAMMAEATRLLEEAGDTFWLSRRCSVS